MDTLNIFYAEPDPDRWLKYDRYPRAIIRRIVRGKLLPGGQMLVALQLMQGLKKIGVNYRFNDYKYIRKHPEEIACIIGKPHLLYEKKWANPILFGASTFSHPLGFENMLTTYPNIKKILVPGEWMRKMFEPYYGDKVISWPVGIDTEYWSPSLKNKTAEYDFLIYDKIRWEHDKYAHDLIDPIKKKLTAQGLKFQTIQYGNYKPAELVEKLSQSKAVIFLCEHETQGLAYQQILSTNTPILAWDRGGYWQDPYYYPEKVKFETVSSVPYWDERCGYKFKDMGTFDATLTTFLQKSQQGLFTPRDYILENLSLEKCAEAYVNIYRDIKQNL
jgi:glycosyltransferase involved in cell wall biosynthesis